MLKGYLLANIDENKRTAANTHWRDRIRDDIAPKVAADPAYRNAKQNTQNAARIEHDKALARVMLTLLKDDTQVYKQFVENESFHRFVTDMVFGFTSG